MLAKELAETVTEARHRGISTGILISLGGLVVLGGVGAGVAGLFNAWDLFLLSVTTLYYITLGTFTAIGVVGSFVFWISMAMEDFHWVDWVWIKVFKRNFLFGVLGQIALVWIFIMIWIVSVHITSIVS